jgi:phosphoglycolate phosphatase-like HAD superfamily hydrolase
VRRSTCIPHTVEFRIDGAEFHLYRDVTRFVKQQSAKAAAQGDDPRARAVGFLMSLYQRRLASSTYAMRHSLESRAQRLEEALKRAQDLARLAPPELPDPEELEEMEGAERERLEEQLEAVTLAAKAHEVHEEIQELRRLAGQARGVEESGCEAKLSKLKELLQQEGFFDQPEKRLLIFTEFKDTLDYLVERLSGWGFRVGFIHGGMKPGRATSRGRDCLPSSSSGKGRSRSWWRPRRPEKGSIFRSATFFSTMTFRGIRTGWSSGWAASTGTDSARIA